MTRLVDASGPAVRLVAGSCENCGYVFYPLQTYGCERCGHDDQIRESLLHADGVVEAATTVHLHPDPARPAPFIVVRVKLDAGPVVRAVFGGDAEPPVGSRVEGWIDPAADDAETGRGFRFASAASEGALP